MFGQEIIIDACILDCNDQLAGETQFSYDKCKYIIDFRSFKKDIIWMELLTLIGYSSFVEINS